MDTLTEIESRLKLPMNCGDVAVLAAKAVDLFRRVDENGTLADVRDRVVAVFEQIGAGIRSFQIWVPAIGAQEEFFAAQAQLLALV